MHVFVAVKDVWVLVEKVIEELCHQQGCSLILFSREVHLLLQLNIVTLQMLVLMLRLLKLLLDLLQLVL